MAVSVRLSPALRPNQAESPCSPVEERDGQMQRVQQVVYNVGYTVEAA
jgi:hypothetical protein